MLDHTTKKDAEEAEHRSRPCTHVVRTHVRSSEGRISMRAACVGPGQFSICTVSTVRPCRYGSPGVRGNSLVTTCLRAMLHRPRMAASEGDVEASIIADRFELKQVGCVDGASGASRSDAMTELISPNRQHDGMDGTVQRRGRPDCVVR